MDTSKKDTFDSVNNDINLYKDELEIVDGMLAFYKSLFDLRDSQGKESSFIIDYGVNIIENYRQEWIKLFDNILIFKNNILDFPIKDIKAEDYNYIIYGMEKIFLKEYELFLNSWDIEAATFSERNSNTENIRKYMIEQSKEEIRGFNIKYIKDIIYTERNNAEVELKSTIKAFNKSVYIEKEDLKYFINHEGSMDLKIFYDEVNFIRESVLNKFDDLMETIEDIIKEKLVKKTLKQINAATEEKLNCILTNYKEAINKCCISKIQLKEDSKVLRGNNKLLSKNSFYTRCVAILENEITYFQFVKAVGGEYFRIQDQEAKGLFNEVFTSEFYGGIYSVQFYSDFENLIEAYNIKVNFILDNLLNGLLLEYIKGYEEIVVKMLQVRKNIISKLYIFKPITYMGNFNIYEPIFTAQLHNLLSEVYNSYDFKDNKNRELMKIKTGYVGLKEEVEKGIKIFKQSLGELQMEEKNYSVNEATIKVYEAVGALKEYMWKVLHNRFVKGFAVFNGSITQSIEVFEREVTLYEGKVEYQD